MYKYNKYKQKYLNLLHGGSNIHNKTYNINIINMVGNIIHTINLNFDTYIPTYVLKGIIIDDLNISDENSIDLLNNTDQLNDDYNITSELMNKENNINLTIVIKEKISLYTILCEDVETNLEKKYNELVSINDVLVQQRLNIIDKLLNEKNQQLINIINKSDDNYSLYTYFYLLFMIIHRNNYIVCSSNKIKINFIGSYEYCIIYNCRIEIIFSRYGYNSLTIKFYYEDKINKNIINFIEKLSITEEVKLKNKPSMICYTISHVSEELSCDYTYNKIYRDNEYNNPGFSININTQHNSCINNEVYKKILSLIEVIK